MTSGCDCLGEIFYFDGYGRRLIRRRGDHSERDLRAREDYGISWKHTDFRSDEVEVRRARRLMISMICTVGNYEYGSFWYF